MQVRTDKNGCALGLDIVKALNEELDIEHDAAVQVALAVADSKNMGKLARGFATVRLERIRQLVADSKDKVVSSAAEAKDKIDARMAEAKDKIDARMAEAKDKFEARMAEAQAKIDSKVAEAQVKVTAQAEQAGTHILKSQYLVAL
jgi:ABC-type phosphate transport system auxiliary subunit